MIVRAYYCSGRGGADVELRLSPLQNPSTSKSIRQVSTRQIVRHFRTCKTARTSGEFQSPPSLIRMQSLLIPLLDEKEHN